MMSTSAETLRRLDNIDRMIEEGHRRDALHAPLVRFLHPKWFAAQMSGVGMDGMSIHLPVREWQKQHEAGIDRCLGFHIEYWK